MTALQLVLPALSLLALGAHFLRAGAALPMLVALGALGLLLVRHRWAARAVQVVLVLGTLEWIRATIALTGERMSEGLGYGRMVGILGGVAALSAVSAMLFRSRALRRWFRAGGPGSAGGAP